MVVVANAVVMGREVVEQSNSRSSIHIWCICWWNNGIRSVQSEQFTLWLGEESLVESKVLCAVLSSQLAVVVNVSSAKGSSESRFQLSVVGHCSGLKIG